MVSRSSKVLLKSGDALEAIRQAGGVVDRCLDMIRKEAKPGQSLSELDRRCAELIKSASMLPCLGEVRKLDNARPFDYAVSLCVNQSAIFGAPIGYELAEGDLLSAEVGVSNEGWHALAATSLMIGAENEVALTIIEAAHSALEAAIAQIQPGAPLRKISSAIEDTLRKYPLIEPVKEYGGHGIGRSLVEAPDVPNYLPRGWPGALLEQTLEAGTVLVVSPIVAEGWARLHRDGDKGLVTLDGGLAAHVSETIVVTESGHELLTHASKS